MWYRNKPIGSNSNNRIRHDRRLTSDGGACKKIKLAIVLHLIAGFAPLVLGRRLRFRKSSEVELDNHRETLSKLGWNTTILSRSNDFTNVETQQIDTRERELLRNSNGDSTSMSYSVSYSYGVNSRRHGWRYKTKKKPPPPPLKKSKSTKGSYSYSYQHHKKKKKKKKHKKSLSKKSKKSPKSEKKSKGKSKHGSLSYSYSYPYSNKKKKKSGPKSKSKGSWSKGGWSSYSYNHNSGSSSSKKGSKKGGKYGHATMKRSFGTTPHKEKNFFLRLKMERSPVFNNRSWRHQPDGEYNSNF